MKVLSIVGNRPQFVKSAPLSLALAARGVEEVVLHTGQHYDPELSQVFFDELGLAEPAHRLDLGGLTREELLARGVPAVQGVIAVERPDWVLVCGDTNSTLAGARAGVLDGTAVAHVEAGLRSGDISMPEELNRIETDRLSAMPFRSAEAAGYRVIVLPACCRACGFTFDDRKLSKPSKLSGLSEHPVV